MKGGAMKARKGYKNKSYILEQQANQARNSLAKLQAEQVFLRQKGSVLELLLEVASEIVVHKRQHTDTKFPELRDSQLLEFLEKFLDGYGGYAADRPTERNFFQLDKLDVLQYESLTAERFTEQYTSLVQRLSLMLLQATDDSMKGGLTSAVNDLKQLLVGTLLWNPLIFMHMGAHHLVSGKPIAADADHSTGTISGIGLDQGQEEVLTIIGALYNAQVASLEVGHTGLCRQLHAEVNQDNSNGSMAATIMRLSSNMHRLLAVHQLYHVAVVHNLTDQQLAHLCVRCFPRFPCLQDLLDALAKLCKRRDKQGAEGTVSSAPTGGNAIAVGPRKAAAAAGLGPLLLPGCSRKAAPSPSAAETDATPTAAPEVAAGQGREDAAAVDTEAGAGPVRPAAAPQPTAARDAAANSIQKQSTGPAAAATTAGGAGIASSSQKASRSSRSPPPPPAAVRAGATAVAATAGGVSNKVATGSKRPAGTASPAGGSSGQQYSKRSKGPADDKRHQQQSNSSGIDVDMAAVAAAAAAGVPLDPAAAAALPVPLPGEAGAAPYQAAASAQPALLPSMVQQLAAILAAAGGPNDIAQLLKSQPKLAMLLQQQPQLVASLQEAIIQQNQQHWDVWSKQHLQQQLGASDLLQAVAASTSGPAAVAALPPQLQAAVQAASSAAHQQQQQHQGLLGTSRGPLMDNTLLQQQQRQVAAALAGGSASQGVKVSGGATLEMLPPSLFGMEGPAAGMNPLQVLMRAVANLLQAVSAVAEAATAAVDFGHGDFTSTAVAAAEAALSTAAKSLQGLRSKCSGAETAAAATSAAAASSKLQPPGMPAVAALPTSLQMPPQSLPFMGLPGADLPLSHNAAPDMASHSMALQVWPGHSNSAANRAAAGPQNRQQLGATVDALKQLSKLHNHPAASAASQLLQLVQPKQPQQQQQQPGHWPKQQQQQPASGYTTQVDASNPAADIAALASVLRQQQQQQQQPLRPAVDGAMAKVGGQRVAVSTPASAAPAATQSKGATPSSWARPPADAYEAALRPPPSHAAAVAAATATAGGPAAALVGLAAHLAQQGHQAVQTSQAKPPPPPAGGVAAAAGGGGGEAGKEESPSAGSSTTAAGQARQGGTGPEPSSNQVPQQQQQQEGPADQAAAAATAAQTLAGGMEQLMGVVMQLLGGGGNAAAGIQTDSAAALAQLLQTMAAGAAAASAPMAAAPLAAEAQAVKEERHPAAAVAASAAAAAVAAEHPAEFMDIEAGSANALELLAVAACASQQQVAFEVQQQQQHRAVYPKEEM